MIPKVLVDMNFTKLIGEASATTSTGQALLQHYQSYLMTAEESCGLINQFVKEALQCRYDNGVNEALERVSDYISQNKTLWAIASACESINASASQYNMLNRQAARQAEKLLEMSEEDAVKWIRGGALKNVMYCEAFRNIAKATFKDRPIIEQTADYTRVTPCSIVENVGDGHMFVVAGKLFKLGDDQNIQEGDWSDVSNTFKTVASLLESNLVEVTEDSVVVNFNNTKYTIKEQDKVVREGKEGEKEMSAQMLREHNRMVLMTVNPRMKNQVASVLEAIALLAENYDKVATMDKAAIYTTNRDKFLVIEAGTNLYATLLGSNHSGLWTVNEDAMKTLDYIKKQTNVQLSEEYKSVVEAAIEATSQEEKEKMQQQLQESEVGSIKERIEALTKRFANDPTKLAVLSKLASEVAEL